MRPVEELDLLFALQTAEGVQKVYELDPAPARDDDAARFLVAVHPYKQSIIVAAQYRAIDALHGGRLRNVLFFDDEHPPPMVQRARAVSLSVQEREAAAFRHFDRSLLRIAQSLVVPEPDPFPEELRVTLPHPPSARCSDGTATCTEGPAMRCGRRGFPSYRRSWTHRCSPRDGA